MPPRSASPSIRSKSPSRRITIGYVPLTDCSPLIAAHELGLFLQYDLDVRLSREAGWASVREKMLHGEIDAAHAPASMVFEMTLGLGVAPVQGLTGLVLAHNGNAIAISRRLHEMGVTDAKSLKEVIRRNPGRRFTFAGVLKYSSQHYLMRQWLLSGGIDPDRDVDIAIVPPPLVADLMEQGHLDGYCVAEPWTSTGLLRGIGWCVTLSADLDPMHPEKIFLVRREFEEDRHNEHIRLIAALLEAARWCDRFPNRRALSNLLASPAYLSVPVSAIRNALVGPYQMGDNRTTDANSAIVFHRNDASRPSIAKARWVMDAIRRHGLAPGLPPLNEESLHTLFREDLYDEALALSPAFN